MAKVHIILQGKGGVGKSVIASLIAQYQLHQQKTPLCIDTDPVNATFEGYKALNVKRLEIMENKQINPRKFDALIEMIVSSETDVIIDNGASSFVPLSHYLISNDVASLLTELGYELVIHTIITGSQSLLDTVSGFAQLASQFPTGIDFVVWLNHFWGDVESGGKAFTEMKAYTQNRERVTAIIEIPKLSEETYGKDFCDLLEAKKTFAEALSSEDLGIMTRQRLKIIQRNLFEQFESAMVL